MRGSAPFFSGHSKGVGVATTAKNKWGQLALFLASCSRHRRLSSLTDRPADGASDLASPLRLVVATEEKVLNREWDERNDKCVF